MKKLIIIIALTVFTWVEVESIDLTSPNVPVCSYLFPNGESLFAKNVDSSGLEYLLGNKCFEMPPDVMETNLWVRYHIKNSKLDSFNILSLEREIDSKIISSSDSLE